MQNGIIGYRKVLVVVLGMLATWAINKGMAPELANSIQGVLIEILPTVLSILYMRFNNQAKRILAPPTTTPAATAATAATAEPAPAAAAAAPQPAAAPSPEPIMARPPNADTMPPFTAEDDCLTVAQRQAIAIWYAEPTNHPPVIPIIPKESVTLYMDKLRQDERRALLAGEAIMQQALDLFKGEECDRVLKMRKSCDVAIWHRVNYHWNEAMDRWMRYATDLWKYQEAIP